MENASGFASSRVFEEALDFVLKSGALCVDNLENVRRGETFMGISREVNPEWSGWIVLDRVDAAFGRAGAVPGVASRALLRSLVRSFYRDHYWQGVFADTMPEPLAAVIFDSAVVHGKNRAFRFLQEALNTVCGVRRLDVDGIFRKDSRMALCAVLGKHEANLKMLVEEVVRVRQTYCDLIACGGRSGCCRARIRELSGLVEGYYGQDGLVLLHRGRSGGLSS